MGIPYSDADMKTTVTAIAADPLAYGRAKADYEKGKITKDNLQDFSFISHHYLPQAKQDVINALSGGSNPEGELADALEYRELLKQSAGAELDAMADVLNGCP